MIDTDRRSSDPQQRRVGMPYLVLLVALLLTRSVAMVDADRRR
jgi:hypothetical protein